MDALTFCLIDTTKWVKSYCVQFMKIQIEVLICTYKASVKKSSNSES